MKNNYVSLSLKSVVLATRRPMLATSIPTGPIKDWVVDDDENLGC